MKNTLNNNDPSSLSQIEEMDFLVIMEFKEDISKYTANNEIGNILAEISKLHLSLNPPASFKEMSSIRLAISAVFSKPIAMSHMVRYAFTMHGDRTHLDHVLGALKILSCRTSKICMLDGVILNPELSMAGERDEVLTAYSSLNSELGPLNLSPTVSVSQLDNIEHQAESKSALEELIDEYQAWNHDNGLNLGSADEHFDDENLTKAQREWLRDFSVRWDAAKDIERDKSRLSDTPTPVMGEQS